MHMYLFGNGCHHRIPKTLKIFSLAFRLDCCWNGKGMIGRHGDLVFANGVREAVGPNDDGDSAAQASSHYFLTAL